MTEYGARYHAKHQFQIQTFKSSAKVDNYDNWKFIFSIMFNRISGGYNSAKYA